MSRVLISSVVWCPVGHVAREDTILRHLNHLNIMKSAYDFVDLLIILNDVTSVRILDFINQMDCVYLSYIPQKGWARGRNICMNYFHNHPEYVRLAMCDCDQCWDDLTWPEKVLSLHNSDPNIHAYMIRMDKYQKNFTARLDSGTLIDIYGEWLGTSNVCDRYVVEQVGCLNTITFPQGWGFHDCEWARRLKKSGCLDATRGYYADPIRITGSLDHDQDYNAHLESLKLQCIREYNPKFIEREREILQGINVYIPFDGNTL